jgi:hypothetical protein
VISGIFPVNPASPCGTVPDEDRGGGEKGLCMSEDNILTRREFTLESALAILSAATITISCGDDKPSTTPTTTADKNGTVSANHGHVAVITSAQLTSPTTISLNIQGQATHAHTVDITAAEVSSIAANVQVAKMSSTDNAHNHTVTFN